MISDVLANFSDTEVTFLVFQNFAAFGDVLELDNEL